VPVKAVLVTSQVTYMPDNYRDLLESILATHSTLISGVILLENLDSATLKSAIGLPLLGSRSITAQLWRNILELPMRKREKLIGSYGIPLIEAKSMNDPQIVQWVVDHKIDLIINMRTRCIYKKNILQAPRLGCINIHHGLLPTYRGTLCDLYALTEKRPAGFSVHVMDKKIDNGPILNKTIVSTEDKDYLQYLKKTASKEAQVIVDILDYIQKHDSLPEGEPNKTESPIYTKNPTRKQIKHFRSQGYKL
jgi:methionyl-tRNA formyltransferase